MTAHPIRISDHVRPILGAIRTVPVPPRPGEVPGPPPAIPFITLSRQPGAGAWFLAKQFVEMINIDLPEEQRWTCWDRELIEKVASDMHLSARIVDALEDQRHSWFSDFLESLSFSDDRHQANEAKVYNRVAQTIRALAQAGRVVIVGRGGVFITRKLPGGIHIRLVAPFQQRVEFMAREYHLSLDKAALRIKDLEHNRLAFYRRYWPHEILGPETFALTINTADVAQETMIQMLTTLVGAKVPASA